MAYLNLSRLPEKRFMKAQNLNESLGSTPKEHLVFLSYRRADRDYVARVVELLRKVSAKIYVDYLDDELPNIPSDETAKILRTRIMRSKKIIQLVTPNSSGSKWMPWELGLGDGLLGYRNSVTLPAILTPNSTIDQEYLNIYGHIETSSTQESINQEVADWIVKFPQSGSMSLRMWLSV